MAVVDRTIEHRSLNVIERFHAPHVEGPIRLFDEQCLFLTVPRPVVLAAGADDGLLPLSRGVMLISYDGLNFQVKRVAGAEALNSVSRAGGFRALAGTFTSDLWRNVDTLYDRWQRIQTDFPDREPLDVADIEYNPDTGRVLVPSGDLASLGFITLFKTDDQGDTMEEIFVPASIQGCFRSLKYHPITKTWFAVGRRNAAPHAARSFDDGETWELIPASIGSTQRFLDVGVNTITGRVLFLGDGGTSKLSDDNGETWFNSGLGGRPFNTAFSPDVGTQGKGRWVTERSGWVAYSDDDGATWTNVSKPSGLGRVDINDIAWMDNVPFKHFLAVGRATTKDEGFAARSDDGLTWTIVDQSNERGYLIAAPVSDSAPPRQWQLTLPIERLEQVQQWRVETGEPVDAAMLAQDKYRGKGLRDADRDWQPNDFSDRTIVHTREQLTDDVIQPSHWWGRTQSCRITGGYLQVHGQVGRVSKVHQYPEELPGGIRIANIEAGGATFAAPTSSGGLEVNP